MDKEFNTLGDFDYRDKTVLLRVDINCPLDKKTLVIVNDARIRRIVPTVRELAGKMAKVVMMAHQSRKGGWDFIPLEQHAELLSKHLGMPVQYVDDVIGEKAVEAIKALEPGCVLLLGNVRELDSETAKGDMAKHAEGESRPSHPSSTTTSATHSARPTGPSAPSSGSSPRCPRHPGG